jgi:hypothetical protein
MNLALIEGESEIAQGVSTLLLPDHTQGMQGLCIDTQKGKAVIAGDLAYRSYNLNPHISEATDLAGNVYTLTSRPDLPFAPPGIHIDLSWLSTSSIYLIFLPQALPWAPATASACAAPL